MRGQLWTARDLENLPTLSTGQADDLKIDTAGMRVWLCRCGLSDGARFRRGVSVEILRDGKWEVAHEYEGSNA